MIIWVIVFGLGTVFGSFFGTLAMRLADPQYKGARAILTSPSACDHCGRRVPWYGLIPLAGRVLLRGRCRFCRRSIAAQYMVTEAGYGFLAVALFWRFGCDYAAVPLFLALSCAVCIALVDVRIMRVPHSLLAAMFVFTLPAAALFSGFDILDHLYGMLFFGGIFLLIGLLFPGGFGGGISSWQLSPVCCSGLRLHLSLLSSQCFRGLCRRIICVAGALSSRAGTSLCAFLVFGVIMAVLFAPEILMLFEQSVY